MMCRERILWRCARLCHSKPVAEKADNFVIPSEARNPSGGCAYEKKERFLASLRSE
jgi:hypothetical protein